MENYGSFGSGSMRKAVTKKRTLMYRRPQNENQSPLDYGDSSSLSSTPLSDDVSKASIHDAISRASYANLIEAETSVNVSTRDEQFTECTESYIKSNGEGINLSRSPQDDIGKPSWDSMNARDAKVAGTCSNTLQSGQIGGASDGSGNDNKLRKVKLKVGGVTRTIHTNSLAGSSSTKSSSSSDIPHPQYKGNSSEDRYSAIDKHSGLRGVPWKDFSATGFSIRREDSSRRKIGEESNAVRRSGKYETAQKSKRAPKKRSLGESLDDDDDDEIRYLEKLRTSRYPSNYSAEYEEEDLVGSKKQFKVSRLLSRNSNGHDVDLRGYDSSRSGKEIKPSKSGRASKSGMASEDTDYVEEEESVSEVELEPKKKKQRKESVDVFDVTRREMAITTRQRALQTGKDIALSAGASLVEFPHGLPPAPPKKQKDKLSEVEQQLKKAEAAERRRMQAEKAARESEAEAIRKILGQDSSRKKREDKIKKRQEEIAQERTAKVEALSFNAVRWIMRPSGTVVTFPDEMGLPSIFEPSPCSYPPPREKCAGPSCPNTYKYRDSKSKLPLCSLRCYKAIHEKMQLLSAC